MGGEASKEDGGGDPQAGRGDARRVLTEAQTSTCSTATTSGM